jgi:putative membrane protein
VDHGISITPLLSLKIQANYNLTVFWHKKADIGSIIIHTAGGDLVFN